MRKVPTAKPRGGGWTTSREYHYTASDTQLATTLINGIKQPDGTIKNLPIKQVADILGHTTTEITELYYVRRESDKLNGVTDGFEL